MDMTPYEQTGSNPWGGFAVRNPDNLIGETRYNPSYPGFDPIGKKNDSSIVIPPFPDIYPKDPTNTTGGGN